MKADTIHRLLAKLIDFFLVGMLSKIAQPFGIFASVLYLLISDGLFDGQSIGKRIIGLKVLVTDDNGNSRACGFQSSMVRNLPFSVFVLFAYVPLLNVLFVMLGVLFCLLETYFVIKDEKGVRMGDIYADSRVVQSADSEK